MELTLFISLSFSGGGSGVGSGAGAIASSVSASPSFSIVDRTIVGVTGLSMDLANSKAPFSTTVAAFVVPFSPVFGFSAPPLVA